MWLCVSYHSQDCHLSQPILLFITAVRKQGWLVLSLCTSPKTCMVILLQINQRIREKKGWAVSIKILSQALRWLVLSWTDHWLFDKCVRWSCKILTWRGLRNFSELVSRWTFPSCALTLVPCAAEWLKRLCREGSKGWHSRSSSSFPGFGCLSCGKEPINCFFLEDLQYERLGGFL